MRLIAIRIVMCAVCALAVSGCGRREVGSGTPVPLAAQVAPTTAAARKAKTLAYEHTVRIELPKEQLPLRMREVQNACTTNQSLECTLLDVSFNASEAAPSGSITMRLAPAAVDTILQIAANKAKSHRAPLTRKIWQSPSRTPSASLRSSRPIAIGSRS